jgi:hypothetical protein
VRCDAAPLLPLGPMSEHDEPAETTATRPDEIPPPVGTVFFVTIYLMVMAGLWGAIYFLMLER